MRNHWKKLAFAGFALAMASISASAARSEWAMITYFFDDGSYAGVGIYPCVGGYTLNGTVTQNAVIDKGPCGLP